MGKRAASLSEDVHQGSLLELLGMMADWALLLEMSGMLADWPARPVMQPG
jgi:hypothetical protein